MRVFQFHIYNFYIYIFSITPYITINFKMSHRSLKKRTFCTETLKSLKYPHKQAIFISAYFSAFYVNQCTDQRNHHSDVVAAALNNRKRSIQNRCPIKSFCVNNQVVI